MAAHRAYALCAWGRPVVMPIHMQVEGSSAPELNQSGNATYVMTAQGPVQLPVVLGSTCSNTSTPTLVLPQARALWHHPQQPLPEAGPQRSPSSWICGSPTQRRSPTALELQCSTICFLPRVRSAPRPASLPRLCPMMPPSHSTPPCHPGPMASSWCPTR